jgi:hypothetical protein
VGVLTHCEPDVDRLCADAKAQVHGNAVVLRCLVENFAKTGGCGVTQWGSCRAFFSMCDMCDTWVLESGVDTCLYTCTADKVPWNQHMLMCFTYLCPDHMRTVIITAN